MWASCARSPSRSPPWTPRRSASRARLSAPACATSRLPQKFSKADLRAGHEFAISSGLTFTEDATMCADAGIDVFFVEGDERNLKVTTPGDVNLATHLLRHEGEEDV
ncbi:IspD/TarI family cytidylyltransferase [Demequina litorisediminis]|uniref:IspD/TarI family cytidylyltransferase n=1 Tax=Demequina litorisediminis TaxID=1849022 RepID=UPI0024E0FC88|nr:2-C-methyl-D-erythritol 4-phosphate cytidylyltransferase [Demequina litorisediminis]